MPYRRASSLSRAAPPEQLPVLMKMLPVCASDGYSNGDLDKIIADMFSGKRGGSAAMEILPEDQVSENRRGNITAAFPSTAALPLQCLAGIQEEGSARAGVGEGEDFW